MYKTPKRMCIIREQFEIGNRVCIHGRSEKQKCRLCGYVSECCGQPIYSHTTAYICTTCHQPCDMIKINKKVDK